MNQIKNIQLKKFRWFLLGCAPLFFFLRGIHLILTGGGWIASTDQSFHWILLFTEISIAAFSTIACFYLWLKDVYIKNKKILKNIIVIKTIILAIVFTFIIHFVRVGFWIQNTIL
jgi:hypothetical protein